MTKSRAALASVILLASIVGACSGISRIGAIQPPSAVTDQAALQQFALQAAPVRQLGIGVDFYTYPGQNVVADAAATVAYVKSLHANALSISFPFFMHGGRSSRVYATDETPSPADVAVVAGMAERAGLYVSIRPLLDETSLGQPRTNWKPHNLAAWFGSYRKFILPYAVMAQQALIPELVDGTELDDFNTSARWNPLVGAIRNVYRGTLVYDNNWGLPMVGGGDGVVEAVDTYEPMPVPPDASIAQLTPAWIAYDRTLPRGTVELEVDIAAVRGAYSKPYDVQQWNTKKLVPSVQVNWFTAACNAVARTYLGGIYFWSIGLGQSLTTPPDFANPGSWVDSPGAVAIAACFAKLGGK